MGVNYNRPPASRKATPAKAKKSSKDFPLSIHKGTGYWCKKVAGRVYYFGKVADDPKGVAAKEEWLDQKDDLLAGREPRARKPDELTVADLCNDYLEQHEARRDDGAISPRTFHGLHATCVSICKTFPKTRAVTDLGPDDFAKLRKFLAKNRKAVALRNEMQRVRSVFLFAYVNGLIQNQVRYGTMFDKPQLKQVRKERREHRQKHGDRMFEAAEIRQILAEVNQPLRAMVLLAVNCGFGQSDIAHLPISSVDLDKGMIDYPRPKTEVSRLCPLWPETVEAIREWLPQRPKAKERANAGLLFLTCRGAKWVKVSDNGAPKDAIAQEFNRVLKRLGLKRSRLGFYGLRHSFRTIADETLDSNAIDLIMGHVDPSMAGHYRERIGVDRLSKVADHVRTWVFN